jgi:aminoglycoside phosphotransferase (APT) family kinase protein
MAREFRVLRAVHAYFPLAPRPFLLCEDVSIIGAVFFVMERRKGVVVRSQVPACFEGMKDFPPCASRAAVDTLAALHAVDVGAEGVAGLGKPGGFVGRQVSGWADRWYRARTEELPQMDLVIRWLSENVPPSSRPTIVHNDFKLDNLMLDWNDPGRVVAVLDWEMTTIGDPLVDLGLTLTYWAPPEGPGLHNGPVPAITTEAGWYTREQFLDHYAKATGRDLTHIGFHEVLGIFKLAVIVQQIYHRFVKGQTRDERFSQFYLRVRSLIEAAAQRIEKQA